MSSGKRIILITGANTGIGYDTALLLARADSRNHVIIGQPQALSLQKLDVTSDESISQAVKDIEANFNTLDVLVNNAGILLPNLPTRATLRELFEVNLLGPVLLTDALAPLLAKSNDPRIINVSSGLGSIEFRLDKSSDRYDTDNNAYRMSKAALNMASANQKFNYREKKFKVWSYCPGFVATNIYYGDAPHGEEAKKAREAAGAESSETSAQGILDIVDGKKDAEQDAFIRRYEETWPW